MSDNKNNPNSISHPNDDTPTTFLSREAMRKQRELAEARKIGLVPAEKDEDGRDINPHIPQYIVKAPWYLAKDQATSLKHQRLDREAEAEGLIPLSDFDAVVQKRGVRPFGSSSAKRFRPGACENCGALTHAIRDCVERPRLKGAKWTKSDICPDEYIPFLSSDLKKQMGFDGKRDRWSGFDGSLIHQQILESKFEKNKKQEFSNTEKVGQLQELLKSMSEDSKEFKKTKRRIKRLESQIQKSSSHNSRIQKNKSEEISSDELFSEDEENENDEEFVSGDFDKLNAPVDSLDDRTRTTTRNLRIREDTAKYLLNLDLNSAFYDPKTRSMRDDPLKNVPMSDGQRHILYAGDNVLRQSGDALIAKKYELFSWEAYKRGGKDILPVGLPTQLEMAYKDHLDKKSASLESTKNFLVDKYKTEIKTNKNILDQIDNPIEIVKEKQKIDSMKSIFEEDVFELDHKSIWGSFFDISKQKWGYKCCRSTSRMQPCVKGILNSIQEQKK